MINDFSAKCDLLKTEMSKSVSPKELSDKNSFGLTKMGKRKGPILPTNRNSIKNKLDAPIFASRQFPISIWGFLSSLIFWCIMAFLAVKAFQFLSVYHTLNNEDIDGDCDEEISKSMDENMRIIESYPMGDAKPYLDRIGSQRFTDSLVGTPAPQEMTSLPPVVMAIASEDFQTVQRSISKIKENNDKGKFVVQLIIYDIGLYKSEKEILNKYCGCEVRTFDPKIYPDHVAYMANKAYRPIIIQTIIEEFGSIIWLEPSSVLKNVNDLQMLKYRGNRHFFLWEEPAYEAITAYTHPKMFDYLGEKRCSFKDLGMLDIRNLVLYRTNETWFSIMKPWLKCALNRDCIAPKGARGTECFHYMKPKMTGCHWYDQSIFSIIMNRAYQFNHHQDQFSVPRLISLEQEEIFYYFPEQPWSYPELLLCFTLPFVVYLL
ncbi:hypothetical protein FSP39_012838 [Pinctada imbricata]|uniref:Uncharacterized protein n=1 Tax=Pinctada imbricata TaxID=66713 RepID=A0AA88YHB8_PINIB|nr:hypothetical protein FSP39_012838 [Pinctada imbricata]